MADLSVTLCATRLANPLVLASGPLSWNAEGIRAAYDSGVAAVVTKTIRPEAADNPVPHIATAGSGTLLNTEKWSDLPAAQWIEKELPALRDRDGLLIASVGQTAPEVAQTAGPLMDAGADMLELVSYRAEDAAEMVRAAREAVTVPVLIKVSANWPNLVEVVTACLDEGADGVTAIDSIGPALRIDVESGEPELGSMAWLSGRSILPLSMRAVAEICLRHDVPVVGTGGVGQAEDVVEMVMAGATAVGVHSVPLLRGLGWFGKTISRLDRWLDARGHGSLSELRGRALPGLRAKAGHTPLAFCFDVERCNQCNRCVIVCAYGARNLTPEVEMQLDTELCRSCGLCVTVCPTDALQVASSH